MPWFGEKKQHPIFRKQSHLLHSSLFPPAMDFTTIGDNNCVSYSNRAAITSSQQHLFCYQEVIWGQAARPCAPVILEPVILDSRENSHAIPNRRFALMVGAVSVLDKNEMPFSIKKQQQA